MALVWFIFSLRITNRERDVWRYFRTAARQWQWCRCQRCYGFWPKCMPQHHPSTRPMQICISGALRIFYHLEFIFGYSHDLNQLASQICWPDPQFSEGSNELSKNPWSGIYARSYCVLLLLRIIITYAHIAFSYIVRIRVTSKLTAYCNISPSCNLNLKTGFSFHYL